MSATSFPWATLVFVALIAGFVYAGLRLKRTRAEHRARSEERAAELLQTLREHGARVRTQAPEPVPAGAPSVERRPNPQASVASPLRRKPSLLNAPQRMLYLLLRAAMPDHIVMACIRLADLVEPPSRQSLTPDAETRMRQLLLERADCVVLNSELMPLAAVMVYDAATEQPTDERIKAEALRELGIRFLRFRADSLPRPAEMRALVLG